MKKIEKRLGREQLKALNSAIRHEVLVSLRAEGEATASELAERLVVDELLLYYHLKILLKAGLISAAGTRPTATKPEITYEAGPPGLVDDLNLNDEDTMKDLCRNVETILRSATKEYRRAIETLRNEAYDQCHLVRLTLAFSETQRRDFVQKLFGLIDEVRNAEEPDAEKFNLTLVITPVIKRGGGQPETPEPG